MLVMKENTSGMVIGVGVHTPTNVHACIHLASVGNVSKTTAKNKETKSKQKFSAAKGSQRKAQRGFEPACKRPA